MYHFVLEINELMQNVNIVDLYCYHWSFGDRHALSSSPDERLRHSLLGKGGRHRGPHSRTAAAAAETGAAAAAAKVCYPQGWEELIPQPTERNMIRIFICK